MRPKRTGAVADWFDAMECEATVFQCQDKTELLAFLQQIGRFAPQIARGGMVVIGNVVGVATGA